MNHELFHAIQHPKKRQFLAAYSELGNVSQAAKLVAMDRGNHPRWMREDPEYAEAFAEAKEIACDNLEAEARRRAVEGTEKPVFHNGQVCGTIREYSDTLLIFLLKGAMPEKYRERYGVNLQGTVQHTGQVQIYIPDNNRQNDEALPSPDPS